VSHTRFPKEDHLPDWARRDNKVTKDDRVGYFCLTNIKDITSKSKHTAKYPNLLSVMRTVPHSEGLPVQRLRKIRLLAMRTLILVKMTDSTKGTMLTAIRHLKQPVPHLKPIYQHKDILTTFAIIWNCLNNKLNSWTNKKLRQINGSKQRWIYVCEK